MGLPGAGVLSVVAAFIDMMTSADYENHCDPHRTNGCAEHVIIATSEAYSKFKIGSDPFPERGGFHCAGRSVLNKPRRFCCANSTSLARASKLAKLLV